MKAVVLATVCVGAVASSAFAVDLRIKSSLGQTFEINDNRDLRTKPLGVTYAPVSTLLFDVLARTPTTRFVATSNFAYRTYFGPGAVNTMDGLDKDAQTRFTKTTKLTTYDVGASWSERDASNVQLEDVGLATVRGTITTYAVDGGLKHQFSRRDLLTFTARGSSVDFTSPTQNPYDDFTATAIWTHRAGRTHDLNVLVGYYFQDSTKTDNTIWRATGGVDVRLTPQLSFKGSAGAAFLSTTGQGNGGPLLLSTSGESAGWIADALLSYRLRTTTLISVAAARTIAPDSLGDIQQRDILSATLTEQINRRSSLTFVGSFSRNNSGSTGSSDYLNASASYGYRLTPELSTNIAYRYAQRTNGNGGTDGGTARSNSVIFSVKRDVTILP